jgi:transcription elongation factor Elf1
MSNNFKIIDGYQWLSCCPLCESKQIGKVGVLDYSGHTKFSSCWINIKEQPELWQCEACGSGFIQKRIDGVSAEKLYSLGSAAERWVSQDFVKTKTNVRLRL